MTEKPTTLPGQKDNSTSATIIGILLGVLLFILLAVALITVIVCIKTRKLRRSNEAAKQDVVEMETLPTVTNPNYTGGRSHTHVYIAHSGCIQVQYTLHAPFCISYTECGLGNCEGMEIKKNPAYGQCGLPHEYEVPILHSVESLKLYPGLPVRLKDDAVYDVPFFPNASKDHEYEEPA